MAKTILAVDDSSSIRQLLTAILTPSGYRVIKAEDGRDGLEKLNDNCVDLIITDLHMPNLDGIGFINGVRSSSAHRFLPIIILTTEHQSLMKQAGVAAGATAWLTKPFRQDELLTVVRKVIR